MSNNLNSLTVKKHDLLQKRAEALDLATKAFEGGSKTEYDSQMANVENCNKELQQLETLMGECGKSFQDESDLGSRAKGALDHAEKTGVVLMSKICATPEYSAAWLEALAKGVTPKTGLGMKSMDPLYQAENALKALTIGGGDPAGTDGGFLVPEEFNRQINTLAKDYVDLSTLVNVEHVNSNTGWRAVETAGATKLQKLDEMQKITPSSQPKFSKVEYKNAKFGDRLPISNELLADAPGLIRYLAQWFAPKYILTKNDLILTLLNLLEFKAITGDTDAEQIKSVKTMINTGLRTATAKRAVLLTNATGYNVMDNWMDSTGRPILVPDPKDGDVQRFKNKRVVYADADEIPDFQESAATYHPLYLGDLKSAITLFLRSGIRMKSTDIGGDAWETDSTEIRATCRMDAKTVDSSAVIRSGFKDLSAAAAAASVLNEAQQQEDTGKGAGK